MIFNTGAALLDAIVLSVVAKKEEGTYGYGKEYAIDSSGHINVSAEDEFTSTEIKYPSRSI